MKRFREFILSLYRDKHQVVLLTWFYSAVALVSVVVAGFTALFNQPIGAFLFIIPLVAVTALCMNVVCYSLLTVLLGPAAKKSKKKPAKKRTKKSPKKSKKKVK